MVNGRSTFRARMLLFALCSMGLFGCNRPAPTVTPVALPADHDLQARLDDAIRYTYENRHLSTKDQAAWQVVHGALAFGRDFKIYDPQGKLVPAIAYLLDGGQMRGWVLRKGDHGLEAVLEPGSKTGQGHEDQWLGYLSQVGLTLDDPIVVNGEKYTVRDLLTQAQWDVYNGMEATWTLMATVTYLPLNEQWTAKDGTQWNTERIVAMETPQDLSTSACGGCHRMYALAKAVNLYLAEGGKLTDNADGTWEKADKKVQDSVHAAREFQQPDGSFSANCFSRAASSAEIDSRISSTGHVLEFLMVALDDEQIQEPWVTRAVLHLVDCLEKTKGFDLECGALYHAAHSLEMYRERRYGPLDLNAPQRDVATQASAESKSSR